MANCPKCGVHLKLTDWRQHCPHCGANIVVYDLQERLMQQADVAEVQHYHFQKKLDRLKASFIGSKLAVARIVTSFLPVFALLLPFLRVNVNPAFGAYSGGVSLITVYQGVDVITQDGFLTADPLLTASFALLLSSIVWWLAHFLLLMLACSKGAKARAIALHALLLGSAGGALLLFLFDRSDVVLIGKPAIGAYLYLALLLVNAAVDVAVLRQGIPIRHKPCFVGGIPIGEYFELQKSMTPAALRQEQYRRMQALREAREAQRAQQTSTEETEAVLHGG